MFIAHLPAGYLLWRAASKRGRGSGWIMAGAVLPDIDLAYFYLVDAGAVHHHSYLTHRPALWLALLVLGTCIPDNWWSRGICSLAAGGVLHVALDSVLGAIAWGWPFSDRACPLIVIPARYDWWVLSFMTHWSFAIELLICLCAVVVWLHGPLRSGARAKGDKT